MAIVGLCAVALAAAGCTTTRERVSKSNPIEWTTPTKRVVLMDPDVQLGEVGASGAVDWRADWTKTGKDFVGADIKQTLSSRGVDFAESGVVVDPHDVQLIKLHDAVGHAIIMHAAGATNFRLPTKSDPLDFTLGPGVKDLRDKYGADYALFVVVRDTYSSDSRKALQIAGILAAAAGVAIVVPGGQQVGFASLIDLRTGNVVWFNLINSSTGDMREDKGAKTMVGNLLKGLPV
jgi:hypothetical protein